MNWFLYIAIVVVVYVSFIIYKRCKKTTKEVYDPFPSFIMFSRCECQECKAQFDKPFERFEYAYKDIKWFCPDCKKQTRCIILGSFYLKIKSSRELRMEKLDEKWYTDYQREEK